jgi:hypothetical protein
MYQVSQHSVLLHFVFISFVWFRIKSDYFLKSTNQFMFVMVKCDVLFEVRTELFNII